VLGRARNVGPSCYEARHVAVGRVRAGPTRNNTFCPPHTQSHRLTQSTGYHTRLGFPVSYHFAPPAAAIHSSTTRPAAQLAAPAPSGQQWMSARAPDGQRLSFSRTPDDQQRMRSCPAVPTADARRPQPHTPAASTSAAAQLDFWRPLGWVLEQPAASTSWTAGAHALRSRRRSVHGSTPHLLRLRRVLDSASSVCCEPASLRLCVSAVSQRGMSYSYVPTADAR
jgi:hypothetical protein